MRTQYLVKRNASGGVTALHILMAEKALGRKLPPEAEVHHMDGNSLNNSPDNLVICPDRAYHMLLHQRMDAFNACGHYHWRKCPYCKQYDDPTNMVEQKRYEKNRKSQTTTLMHAECKQTYMRNYLKTYRKKAVK